MYEKKWEGMPSILGSQGTGRRIIYPEDDGGEVEIQGDTEVVSKLTQVREIPGKGVTGYTLSSLEHRDEGS